MGILLTGGAALAGTGLLTRGIADNLPEDVKKVLGITDKQIAAGETYDLESGELSSVGVDDWIRNTLLGTDTSSTAEGGIVDTAKGKALDRLYSEVGQGTLSSRLSDLGITDRPELTYTPGEDIDDYKTDIELLRKKTGLLERISANDGDITGLADKSLAELTKLDTAQAQTARIELDENDEYSPRSIAARQEQAEKDRIKREEENKRLDRLQEDRLLAWKESEANKTRAYEVAEGNARRAHEARESDKQIAYEDRVAQLRADNNMRIAMMDRQDKMADRRIAREDRLASQRQQSIMALMKGLTQMGAGFAI